MAAKLLAASTLGDRGFQLLRSITLDNQVERPDRAPSRELSNTHPHEDIVEAAAGACARDSFRLRLTTLMGEGGREW